MKYFVIPQYVLKQQHDVFADIDTARQAAKDMSSNDMTVFILEASEYALGGKVHFSDGDFGFIRESIQHSIGAQYQTTNDPTLNRVAYYDPSGLNPSPHIGVQQHPMAYANSTSYPEQYYTHGALRYSGGASGSLTSRASPRTTGFSDVPF